MGAGKSTAVRALNEHEKGSAKDLDREIEARENRRVLDLFHEDETRFRELERAVALEVLEQADGGIVAFGGGTAMQPDIQAVLGDHTVVTIEVKAADAWERVSRNRERPLAQKGEGAFIRLFEERLPTYEQLAQVVIPPGEPDAIVGALPWIRELSKLPRQTKMLWASAESASYPIFVGRGLLQGGWWPLESRGFAIADSFVGAKYGNRLGDLKAMVEVEPGEQAKSLREMERILRELVAAGMRRDDHVVALGGGVIGDLGGFCAHVFQRGVPVVHVPTTLVSQVDSAYGGKTGVDLPEGKNYVGAYQQPATVLADTSLLDSLPSWELESGFVEVIKTALLAGGPFWERVREVQALDPESIDHFVFECARFKCEVVAEDERDSDRRNILNLGHTVGHAIETATAYEHYSHGEAIGLGLLAALRLSDAPDLRDQVESILGRFSLPVRMRADYVDGDAILNALQRDKKRTARGIGFVLLSEPGKPRTGQLLDPAKVRAAVEELFV
jgi:shikimate kinase/3-dehydroquinate synthase